MKIKNSDKRLTKKAFGYAMFSDNCLLGDLVFNKTRISHSFSCRIEFISSFLIWLHYAMSQAFLLDKVIWSVKY